MSDIMSNVMFDVMSDVMSDVQIRQITCKITNFLFVI